MSGDISLPICTRTSILELLVVPDLHGPVSSIGGEHRYGLLIGLRKYVGYALKLFGEILLRLEPVFCYPEVLGEVTSV